MKIKRSSKTTINFATQKKRDILNEIMDEYSRVANIFIEMFSGNNFQKKDLKKEITKMRCEEKFYHRTIWRRFQNCLNTMKYYSDSNY